MKKRYTALLVAGFLLLTAGCAPADDPPPDTTPDTATTSAVIDPHTLTWNIPEQYQDLLIINADLEDSDEHWVPLLTVYEKASVEAAKADWGDSSGAGFLFGITAMDQVGFEQYLQADASGISVFARDEAWYYAKTFATDVQFYRSEGKIDRESEDWNNWGTLNALGEQVCEDFITRNALIPYTTQEFLSQDFTWEGNHAYAKYYRYYTFDGSQDQFFILVLSQPAKQGESGLWCVERMIDDFGDQYLCFPETDIPAADYYTALQAECDAGQHPELLTPTGAAKDFIGHSAWFSDVATDENVVPADGIDRAYTESNQTVSRIISSLLVQPDIVSGTDVLNMSTIFRPETWGVLGRFHYGSNWNGALQTALQNAALGSDQSWRDTCMMHFYLTAPGTHTGWLSAILCEQQSADPAAFQTALETFSQEEQLTLMSAIS